VYRLERTVDRYFQAYVDLCRPQAAG
jgi:hypothetical protein